MFLHITYIAMSRTEDDLEDKVWFKDKSFQYMVVNNASKMDSRILFEILQIIRYDTQIYFK